MHRTDKYSEHSSIIWSVWPNGRVFVYELSGSGLESSCSHINSCACLSGSGLKVIFHRFAPAFILLKSLFKLVVDRFVLSITEKKSEILSKKSLAFVVRLSEISLIQIKSNNGPRIEPCGTPVSRLDRVSTQFFSQKSQTFPDLSLSSFLTFP